MFSRFKGNDWYVFAFTASELIDPPDGRLEWNPDKKLPGLLLRESDHIFFLGWKKRGHSPRRLNARGHTISGC
jgi:hypothetical protein